MVLQNLQTCTVLPSRFERLLDAGFIESSSRFVLTGSLSLSERKRCCSWEPTGKINLQISCSWQLRGLQMNHQFLPTVESSASCARCRSALPVLPKPPRKWSLEPHSPSAAPRAPFVAHPRGAIKMASGEKASTKRVRNDYEEEEVGKPKKIPRTLVEKTTGKRLIVVLENASLETVKVRPVTRQLHLTV